MGGPGMILSHVTLARVAPHVRECLKNLYTTHEDVELGRCVQKFAGIPCTWSYEVSCLVPSPLRLLASLVAMTLFVSVA